MVLATRPGGGCLGSRLHKGVAAAPPPHGQRASEHLEEGMIREYCGPSEFCTEMKSDATSYLGVDGPLRLEGGRRGGLPVPVVRVRVGGRGVSSVLLRVLLQRGDGGRGL